MLAGAVLVALFTIPTTFEELKIAQGLAAPTTNNANFIQPNERDALNYLENLKEPGSVLTRSYLGAYVPGKTGRRTYVGDCLWSEPGCLTLTNNANTLFHGSLTPADAQKLRVEQRRAVRACRLPDHRRPAEAARPDHPLGARIWMRGGV